MTKEQIRKQRRLDRWSRVSKAKRKKRMYEVSPFCGLHRGTITCRFDIPSVTLTPELLILCFDRMLEQPVTIEYTLTSYEEISLANTR